MIITCELYKLHIYARRSLLRENVINEDNISVNLREELCCKTFRNSDSANAYKTKLLNTFNDVDL